MVDFASNMLMDTLRAVLVGEAKFLSGVTDEVMQVERNLSTIHSFLREVDQKRLDSPATRDFMKQLKDLAFQAQSVLERYSVKVGSRRQTRSLMEKLQRGMGIFCECYSVHQVGKDISPIRSSLAEITTDLKSLPGGEGASTSTSRSAEQHQLRLEYAHEVEPYFVGMEKDIETLVSMVNGEQRLISICGMGGLGKTTLARKIYNHVEVRRCFDVRTWVCITQQFQAKTILGDILKQCAPEAPVDSMSMPELVHKLHHFLVEKRCLIILDDIWETEHWDILRPAFPMSCKIMFTTRQENIAGHQCHVYKLGFLNEDQGWELLQKVALPLPVETTSNLLEDVGKQIVRNCGGLPLAVYVIGGVLRQKQPTFPEWENVSAYLDTYLLHGGEGHGHRVKHVLDLSYEWLPYYLKPCFLYLGCFGEDQEIEPEKLYLLWMAEGLISHEDRGQNETLRDVAERYLSELAMKCMVQVVKNELFSPNMKFISCKLHDLMYDLSLLKAEEEGFYRCIDNSPYQRRNPSPIDKSVTRLVITAGANDVTLSSHMTRELENIRSILVMRRAFDGHRLDLGDNTICFDKSRYLRILLLEGLGYDYKEDMKLPPVIGKLIHLRYLSLFQTAVKKLPQYVCKMAYLQTLDLRVVNLIQVPNIIWKLKRLKHLFLAGMEVIGGGKLRLDGMQELETLEGIDSNWVRFEDLPKLISLRKLSASVNYTDMSSLLMIVEHANNNQLCETDLDVYGVDFSSDEGVDVLNKVLMSRMVCLYFNECNMSSGFPSYEEGMCGNLVTLTITKCKFRGDAMDEIGKYPMLKQLQFFGEEVVMTEMISRPNSFPQLIDLYFCYLTLEKWEVQERAFPKLQHLSIRRCVNLEHVPDGLRFISTLRDLTIIGMPKEFNARLKEGVDGKEAGEDYAIISHIPFFDIFSD